MSGSTSYSGRVKPSPLDIDALLAYHRATFGDARMEGAGDNGGQGGTGGTGDAGTGGQGGAGGDGGRTFTQADVNAMLARERTSAQQTAAQHLATDLGVPVDEAKRLIQAQRDAEQAAMSQAQRDQQAAAADRQQAEADRAEAARIRHEARLERALSMAGLDVTNGVLLRAGLAALDIPATADDAAVTAAVEQAKQTAPQLFGAAASGGGTGGTHTDAGGQRRKEDNNGGEFGSRGAQEAARRWGKDKQAS